MHWSTGELICLYATKRGNLREGCHNQSFNCKEIYRLQIHKFSICNTKDIIWKTNHLFIYNEFTLYHRVGLHFERDGRAKFYVDWLSVDWSKCNFPPPDSHLQAIIQTEGTIFSQSSVFRCGTVIWALSLNWIQICCHFCNNNNLTSVLYHPTFCVYHSSLHFSALLSFHLILFILNLICSGKTFSILQ